MEIDFYDRTNNVRVQVIKYFNLRFFIFLSTNRLQEFNKMEEIHTYCDQIITYSQYYPYTLEVNLSIFKN